MLMLPFVEILTAGKIFLLLTLLVFITGCHKLGKAIHGRPTLLVLPCLFFYYNSMLLYGFVNYLLGVGVFCIAVAYRLTLRDRLTVSRSLLLTLFSFIAFLTHLSAFFFLGMTFLVLAGWNYVTRKEQLSTAAGSLVPLLLPSGTFIMFIGGSGTTGEIEWNTIQGKIVGMLSLVLSYNHKLDMLLIAVFVGILIALAIQLHSVRVHWPIFIAAALLGLLYLVTPRMLFTSSGADARLILPGALLFTLSLKLSLPRRARNLVLLMFILTASVRVLFIWRTWLNLDGQIAAGVESMKKLPTSSAVFPIFVLSEDRQQAKFDRSFDHIVHYATIFRHAFVPTLFARPEQQPLAFRSEPRYTAPHPPFAEHWVQVSDTWLPLLADYEYVWGHRVQGKLEEVLSRRCKKIDESGAFSLWRVDRLRASQRDKHIRICGIL